MPGDRALSMLIDIRARDSASSIVRMLGGVFSGFGLVAKQAGLAFGLFGEAKNLAGMAQLAAAAGHTSAATYLMGQSALKSEAAFGKLRQAAGTLAMSALKLLAAFALVAVVIGIGIGVVAVNAARNFQQQMLKVQALTGASSAEMKKMHAGILAMAPAVGIGPTALAKALYPIESDGFKGAAALNILRLSAIAAKVGLADVNTVAYALTSGIRAFGFADSQATYVMNIMNNTVRQGKMEWGAYAVQVGRLSTAARTSGVSFIEANAALSTLTQSGSSAAKATTFLINLFNQLNLKTDAMAKHAKAAGIAFDEQKFKTMNLGQQIDYLTKITHGSSSEMMKLMGNNSIAVRAYELLAQHSKSYADILKNLNNSQKAGNTLMDSWAKTQQGLTIQVDKGKA